MENKRSIGITIWALGFICLGFFSLRFFVLNHARMLHEFGLWPTRSFFAARVRVL